MVVLAEDGIATLDNGWEVKADTNKEKLKYPIKDNSVTPFNERPNPFDLKDPENVKGEFYYDPITKKYYYKQRLGDTLDYRPENYMTYDEYLDYELSKSIRDYWQTKVSTENEFNQEDGFSIPSIKVENEAFSRIFGSNTIDIRPSGSAELIFGLNVSKVDNPALPENQRRITTFDFDQRIQLNVVGTIGEKLKLTTNYNTESTFDFENQIKVRYEGNEDEIIQSIDAGNVTLPLQGSLITGSQSLFGLKTKLKFGRLDVTSVFSQQRGKKSEIEVKGGSQITTFELKADRYEANKHYFLTHFFRENYEEAVSNPPFIRSDANITKIEVWVTNTNNTVQNTRNFIAFQDLGEENPDRLYNTNGSGSTNTNGSVLPDNNANTLYANVSGNANIRGFNSSTQALDGAGYEARLDYAKVGLARKLNDNEFYFNPQLGFLSVNQELQPNQVLAVAFQYTYRGQTYQVGEFSTDIPADRGALMLKMLKSTELNTRIPMWDLMMKNVYSLGAYQVEKQDFKLDIWYLDREKGVETNFISEGTNAETGRPISGEPLVRVLGLDKLDQNQNPTPDGVFDFLTAPASIPTINPRNGRVYFPLLEPFGSSFRNLFQDPSVANKYAFDSLYTNTPIDARVKFPSQNRFTLKGQYQSSSSNEISLNALNVPQGAVKVTAGGRELAENVDYTVDYTLGRVKILNQGLLESGTPIKISVESNALFNIQTKTLIASRFDYKVSEDFVLGGTIMNLTERPLTQKIGVGEEPISNTVWGVDGTYTTDAPYLTRFVDHIPFIDTKEKSTLKVSGEFAQLIPGHNRAIGGEGTAYIDDFEGSQSTIDLRSRHVWTLASIPQGQSTLFPEASEIDNIGAGFNRALFSWYTIDPVFWRDDANTPEHIRNNNTILSNHFQRQVTLEEVFPNREPANVTASIQPTLDLAFYPEERGPYNYDADGLDPEGTQFGYGVDATGKLNNPSQRWGGMQRKIDQQDFEAANVEFIQFWVMDPFNSDYTHGENSGELYFNIGTVSEDVMRDGQRIFENGLEEPQGDLLSESFLSEWGRTTPSQQYVRGFDNDPSARDYQDVGLDGLKNSEENIFFEDYINKMQGIVTAQDLDTVISDPSSDNFVNFRSDRWVREGADILKSYKFINGMEGNSPVAGNSGSNTFGSTVPNSEDINNDNVLEESESYWQYKVDINPRAVDSANIGRNYINDVLTTSVTTPDGNQKEIAWYQFKIPIKDGIPIGNIRDFKSIRFMRVFMKGFEKPIYLRFARLELVRGEWRKFEGSLLGPSDHIVTDESTLFNVGAVNIEENSEKEPVNYVLPPDIAREINVSSTNLQQLNEQSLQLELCDLKDGDAKAAYRNFDLDVRSYKKIKLYVHANSKNGEFEIQDDELTAFVRLGTDFNDNYYEYEIPLKVSEEGRYNPDDDASRRRVWPEANNIEISFSDLKAAKTSRNRAAITNPDQVNNLNRYAYKAGKATVYVVGNPNLSTLKTVMLGVRNPKQGTTDTDDGLSKCAEVWFNELRLSDFDENSGWAAIANVTAQLADFATVSVSGSMSTPGWGSIEKKVSERQRETKQQFDISANVELGKFLPEKSGVKIPMYVGYSEYREKPQFAPLDPDIEFDDYITESFPEQSQQDSVRRAMETRQIRRSINFTNVRKERTNPQKKPKIYDVSNFSATYSYSEDFRRDFNTEYDVKKSYRGGLTYNFQTAPKSIKPFDKIKFLRKSKYFRPIKDFNFQLYPKQLSMTNDISRTYNESKVRNNYPGIVAEIDPNVNKTFNWNRTYAMRWDLAKSLKLEFNANNKALIEEAQDSVTIVSKERAPDEYEIWKKAVWESISDYGTNLSYNHAVKLTYNLPFKKLPATDWINANIRYTGTYDWQRASFAAPELGNTIQNTQQIQLNSTFNMLTLYNKVKFLREINKKSKNKGRNKNPRNRVKESPKTASKDGEDKEDKKKEKDENKMTILDHTFKALMSIKSASINYSETRGTMLPGYNGASNVLGMDPQFDAPGMGFILGQQLFNVDGDYESGDENRRFLYRAIENDWLVKEEGLANAYSQTFARRLNAKMSVQPIKDLKIELNASYEKSENFSVYNRYYDTLEIDGVNIIEQFHQESPVTSGNFSVSTLSISTAFSTNDDDYVNSAFEEFSANREVVSRRLSFERGEGVQVDTSNYYEGYGGQHPDVLLPAFIAAYTGRDAGSVNLDPFSQIPIPNWRLTYTGLSKIDFFKQYFKSVTVSHQYKSTFVVGGFTSNVNYIDENNDGFSDNRDPVTGTNYVPQYDYQNVTIRESFSPLINIDLSWKNNLQTRFEIKRDRTLSLSVANAQVSEVRGVEYVVGLGYTFKNVKLPFQNSKKKSKISSNLKTRCDFSIRDNYTVLRKLDTEVRPNEPTGGQKILSLKLTADYAMSNKLTVRFFYDRIVNTPVISVNFPNRNTNAGISLRLSLAG